MTVPDLLRLLVVPAFGWVALRDYRTRRVPRRVWYPLAAFGVLLIAWDATAVLDGSAFERRLFLLRIGVSVGLLVPLAYAFHRIGGFGGADAKAFMVIAVLFPAYPSYELGSLVLPLHRSTVTVFSLTVVTDGVLVGAAYPLALAARNALAGRLSPAMFVGRPAPWNELPTTHGKLLESPDGFTRRGLDLDALRMYLRWRGVALSDLRARADALRDPATLPDEPNPPTDGAVDPDADPDRSVDDVDHVNDVGPERAGGGDTGSAGADDPWGAAAFLEDAGPAYGTTPEGLRAGLDLLTERDTVWVSPGIPFLVPLALGLVVALTYGDVLFMILSAAGLVP